MRCRPSGMKGTRTTGASHLDSSRHLCWLARRYRVKVVRRSGDSYSDLRARSGACKEHDPGVNLPAASRSLGLATSVPVRQRWCTAFWSVAAAVAGRLRVALSMAAGRLLTGCCCPRRSTSPSPLFGRASFERLRTAMVRAGAGKREKRRRELRREPVARSSTDGVSGGEAKNALARSHTLRGARALHKQAPCALSVRMCA